MDFFPISQILKITILRQNFSILFFFNQTPFFQHAGHAVRETSVLHIVPFLLPFLTSLLHFVVFIQTHKLIRSASCSFDPLQNSKNSVSQVMVPSRDDLLSVDKNSKQIMMPSTQIFFFIRNYDKMARPSYLLQLINTFGILCMHRYTKVITVSEREKNHYQNSR